MTIWPHDRGQIQQWHFVAQKQSTNTNQQIWKEKEAREDKGEHKAFNMRSQQAVVLYDTLLQEEDQAVSDHIYLLAPGEHQRPCPVLSGEKFKELAYADKNTYGKGGISATRKKPITLCKYFKQCLLNCDGRFAKDLDHLLASQYAVEDKQMHEQVQTVLRQSRHMGTASRERQCMDAEKSQYHTSYAAYRHSIQVPQICQGFSSKLAHCFTLFTGNGKATWNTNLVLDLVISRYAVAWGDTVYSTSVWKTTHT